MLETLKTFWMRLTGREGNALRAEVERLNRSLCVQETSWELACELIAMKDGKEAALKTEIGNLEARIAILEYEKRQMDRLIETMNGEERDRWDREGIRLNPRS